MKIYRRKTEYSDCDSQKYQSFPFELMMITATAQERTFSESLPRAHEEHYTQTEGVLPLSEEKVESL